ncbi:bifunctional UDP-N-acetylglucosamine diphosphorylase/glucosamine-1-phosphate N-acetyltransferase GlmU [Alkaliphilus hydrothermalis]|uniref:Bifunctional protein GlmU n=1 Tax=Alkaliphilus hydrothermalis TaxID=1482730 RepID=A0ABS2NPN7_9FIRM|nr:bifunctional UDP-N-acetylglucosamine diphosphorylase/glucosamine-1-phosphate N-acetyltransferase GlmU [Alkaliphilus hydrothermalis]MBM7614777.1 bifunctional UDP-N-acetylglucosamine pyrophosphorylase/glucosamine-1-phosphate N-acetyltransferase [Alkaliphilus hydrothermalis]
MKLKAIILAAGEGKRMKSSLPKVLHKVCGQSMLEHVVESAEASKVEECIVVVGHGAEEVKKSLPEHVKTVLQAEQLGTGHAVMMAYDHIDEDGLVLVLCGDGPLITDETLNQLMEYHTSGNFSATVLTTDLTNPFGYGRIVRDGDFQLDKIVEEKDASTEEKALQEVNSGIYCFGAGALRKALPLLKNENAQKEYYLTDVLSLIKKDGEKVGVYKTTDYREIMAVNDRIQLAEVEELMRKRVNRKHMVEGVTIIAPNNSYIGKKVKIGKDTIIEPGAMIKGNTIIGEGCTIGANSNIDNCIIGNNVVIQSSTLVDSSVDDYTTVGPYAYLRLKSEVGKHCKIGDFVELKNTQFGDYSKASHLAYIGDAEVGKHVNIGCGVVFVNYDGKKKHKSIVEDFAFVGSNANLIAPVIVRKNGYVASGSTITKEVPEGALAVSRSKQENKEGWVARKGMLKE